MIFAGALYKRRWNPYEKEEKGYDAEVMENVERFAVSYFDGNDWVSDWDSSGKKRLPAAVKIELTLRDSGSTQLYSSIVKVTMGGTGRCKRGSLDICAYMGARQVRSAA